MSGCLHPMSAAHFYYINIETTNLSSSIWLALSLVFLAPSSKDLVDHFSVFFVVTFLRDIPKPSGFFIKGQNQQFFPRCSYRDNNLAICGRT